MGVAATLLDFDRQDSRAGQLILAGDPKQLGPVITSTVCERMGMSKSYMERLTETAVYSPDEQGEFPSELISMLVRNYRSHPSIIKLPNEMFYANKLVCATDKFSSESMAKWEYLPKPSFPIVFHSVQGENHREANSPSWFNPEEAQEVLRYVELLTENSRPPVAPKDIGIITPYARQAQKIRAALRKRNVNDIKVGSVETFQGQERRCIIISTVRAGTEELSDDKKYNLGFVANPKRFNVAVTRARALLIVVGSPRVLATDKKHWLPFLRFCHDNEAWAGEPYDGFKAESDSDAPLDTVLAYESNSEPEWEVLDGPSDAVAEAGWAYVNREE